MLPARVCVPKLGGETAGEGLIREVLQGTGWHVAEGRSLVYEPESNALGLISRGRNATWVPRVVSGQPWWGRAPHLQSMVGPPLSTMFRSMRGELGLLVTDIGAFTTDFGYVRFDASFATDEWNRPTIVQQSCRLGVQDLDYAVISALPTATRAAIAAARPSEWERVKPTLYRGATAALRNPKGGVTHIGEETEGVRIAQAIRAFADRVWDAREAFVRTNVPGPLQAESITGGGAMIPGVRGVLLDNLRQARRRWVYDLLDREEARRALSDDEGNVNHRQLEAQIRINQELIRGGSAIGACSVFFE